MYRPANRQHGFRFRLASAIRRELMEPEKMGSKYDADIDGLNEGGMPAKETLSLRLHLWFRAFTKVDPCNPTALTTRCLTPARGKQRAVFIS